MTTRSGLVLSVALWLACLPAVAWQLQPLSLEERVRWASVVVLGETVTVLERTPSLIGGMGDELLVEIAVGRVLKGQASDRITIRFSEVAVQTPPGLEMNRARIWLLREDPASGEFLAASHFTSILDSAVEIPEYLAP